MASITVDVSEVVRKLDPKKLEKALHSSLGDAAAEVRVEARRYPPPKPTYQRTFTLKRSWTQEVKGMVATIGNNTKYAPFVMDAAEQAWMHRGYWQTTEDIARKKASDVKRIIVQALERWAR